MKAEIDFPDPVIEAIAQRVVARLKPILIGLQTKPTQVDVPTLPQVGYIRLKEVLALIPVSKSTWHKGVADGRYPKPTKKFGSRIAAWDVRDIRPLLERGAD